MNSKYLENLYLAKESIKIWLSNVEQLHYGNQMFTEVIDIDRMKTEFASWYFQEGQTFSSFDTFQVLESFYDESFDIFLKYFKLRNTPLKKSLFSNEKEKRQKELDVVFQDLKKSTRKLIKSVEIFEEKLKNSALFSDVSHPSEYVSDPILTEVDNSEEIIQSEEVQEYVAENIPDTIQEEILEEPKLVATSIAKEEEIVPIVEDSTKELSLEEKIELRIQEEVAKMRTKLEEELKQKITNTQSIKDEKPEVTPIEKQTIPNQLAKPETPKKENSIDIDEEIRRILS